MTLKPENYYDSLQYFCWLVINNEHAYVRFVDRWYCMNDQWSGNHVEMEKRITALKNASEFFDIVELNEEDSQSLNSMPVSISNTQLVFEACSLAQVYQNISLDVVNTVSINIADL